LFDFADHGKILSLALYACNIVAAVNPPFGNHEILIIGSPMADSPIAWLWLLLGYEKVRTISQIQRRVFRSEIIDIQT
jgi:hypothetical protein